MPLLGVGFSMGSSGDGDSPAFGKSLDEIISDRRKEQAKASSGKSVAAKKNGKIEAKNKKTAMADRSIATGRAKRAAAIKARRGLAGNGAGNGASNTAGNGAAKNNASSGKKKKAKASAMEIEKEVYRQSRKTSESKKRAEQKKTGGRLPPNSSLRAKNNTNKKSVEISPEAPAVVTIKQPRKTQLMAAIKGMEQAGCPVPDGFQVAMQFIPSPVTKATKGMGKKSQAGSNKNNNSTNKRNTSGRGRGGKK